MGKDERGPEWRGDDSFGGGWGNQAPQDKQPPREATGTTFGRDAASGDLTRGGAGNSGMFGAEGPDFAIRDAQWHEAVERVRAKMEVVGSDGGPVGTVDKVRGEHLILTRSDAAAGGDHHGIPCGWIARVDDKVTLTMSAADAMQRWRTEGRSRALFERENSGDAGPHVLGSSFSGTYSRDK